MTSAERREREFARIREAGGRRARESPPLTDRQIEALIFILAPTLAALPHARPVAA